MSDPLYSLKPPHGPLASAPTLPANGLAVSNDVYRLLFGDGASNHVLAVKHNVSASAAPTTGDDSADGYSPGSLWIDTTNDAAYICRRSTAGAAVWQQIGSSSSASVPTGTVIDYAGSSAPSGYLACDGATVSRTTYSALFAAIGTAWGAGDGSTTFKLPDLRGRATIGDGTGSGLSARSIGQSLGAETHGLSLGELPSHSHSLPTASATLGAGTTGYSSTGTTNAISGFSTTSGASGGGATHNNMQPSAVTKKCIKT